MNPIDNSKYKFLLDFFVQREGEQILEKIFEIDLVEAGLIDSLDILEIILIIEENLGVKLDLGEELIFEKMRRLSTIIELLEK